MLILLLVVSAGINLIQQTFPKVAIAILVIVIVNALLSFYKEGRAQQALLALRELAQPMVQVRRDGHWLQVASEVLGPGI